MALHFVGFSDDRIWTAYRIFGRPDFYHRTWDIRARQEIVEGDVAIFAYGSIDDPVAGELGCRCCVEPRKATSWDDSQQDIIARGIKGVHW